MELQEAINWLKNPRNPYDVDLNAIRTVLLSLVEKPEPKKETKKKKK